MECGEIIMDVSENTVQPSEIFPNCKAANNSSNYQILDGHSFWFH